MRGKKLSLSETFFLNMIAVAVISIGLLGTLWIIREYNQFHLEGDQMREHYLASQKDLLQHEVERTVDYIQYQKSGTEHRLRTEIRDEVYGALALSSHLYDYYMRSLTRPQLETLIIEALRKMRFNQAGRGGYFFIIDMQGKVLLQDDRPEIEGRTMLGIPGGHGEDVVGDMMAIVSQQGEGYVDYHWTKPDAQGNDHLKIAFVKIFRPLGWIIGTGDYLVNVQEDIQKEVLAQISDAKFGRDGYLFAGTWAGVSLAGPAAGQNILGIKDVNGLPVVKELIKLARSGGGFVRYVMPGPDGQPGSPKISYAQAINDWQWYVGAGLNIDEIEDSIARRRQELVSEVRAMVTEIGLVLAALIAFALILAGRTAVRIKSNYEKFTDFFRESTGKSSLVMEPADTNYLEFETLAHSVNEMVEARRVAEKAMRESQQEYQDLYDQAPDMYISVDPKTGLVVRCNQTMARKLGYTCEEIVGRSMLDLYHPAVHDQIKSCLDRFVIHGEISNEELALRTRDGTRLEVVVNASAVRDDQGHILYCRSALSDITDLRLAREALQESEARFRALIEKAGDLIAIIDRRGTFSYVSPSVGQFGYNSEHLIGRRLEDYLRPDDLHYFRTRLEAAINHPGQAVALTKFSFKKKDETWAAVEGTLNCLYQLQGVDGLAFIGRDISERVRAEEERHGLQTRLLQAQKMEAVGTLAGGIAHDFNNILMSIAGYTSIMELELKPDHPHGEYFQRIQQQVQEASELTRQLLGFAQGGKYEARPMDLNQLASNTVDMFARTKKEIRVQTELDPDLWTVEADRNQMERVILNLLVNAWQAMPAGGDLHLHTANVTLDEFQAEALQLKAGPYVRITVTDTGLGMDPDTLSRVFEPFFTTKTMGRGTGLGLASAYGIVRNHGGAIQAHSEPGRGSAFNIYLPASARAVEPASESEISKAPGSGTILLVDDQPPVADVGRDMLTALGYRVFTAGSGQEAVDLYREHGQDIDLVLLDMIMPGMSGAQTFDELNKINPEVKVLLSSGYSLDDEAETIMNKGCRGFLQKPFHIQGLSAAIKAALNSTCPPASA